MVNDGSAMKETVRFLLCYCRSLGFLCARLVRIFESEYFVDFWRGQTWQELGGMTTIQCPWKKKYQSFQEIP